MMTARLMILNGPNLNLLGVREPHIYGSTTLAAIKASCEEFAKSAGARLSFHQSNHEGALVDLIQAAREEADAIIINPAGYSFTSVAMFDALKIFEEPIIELHISPCPRRTASPLEAFIRRQGGDLRSRTLWLHHRPAGGASHAGTIAGQPADRDPCRSAMRSPSKQPRKLKALRYSARATPAGPQNAAEAGRGGPENHHFCDARHSPAPRFPCPLAIDRRDRPSTEGHREMGMDQTVDHSRDGRIVRPGPARRALPDVVAQAPQP
jgi:3-dehydroquinate dehydratase